LKNFREYTNSLIENKDGVIITPAQADELMEIFEFACDKESNEFNEGNKIISLLKNFLSGLKPSFLLEKLPNEKPIIIEDVFSERVDVDPAKLDHHKEALMMQLQFPGMTYEDAAAQVKKPVTRKRRKQNVDED
jgi:hypothetical protein